MLIDKMRERERKRGAEKGMQDKIVKTTIIFRIVVRFAVVRPR